MKIDVISIFPAMFESLLHEGVTARAIKRKLVELNLVNLRDFSEDQHRTVDDRPYGGGPGMVMMAKPLKRAVHSLKLASGNEGKVVFLSPQGRKFNQDLAQEWVTNEQHLILIAGRYEGIDERVTQSVIDEEISIGDFVLSGGELACMVIVDTLARLIPGALGHNESAKNDSFSTGLLDFPQYTRPECLDGDNIPAVLLSGDHEKISVWRRTQALGKTWEKRPDLLDSAELDKQDKELLIEYIRRFKKA